MRKVNELLREILAEEVTELKDPRIGFVTITGVDTAPNLRNATVFFSVLGDNEAKRETGEGLTHAHSRLQRAIARQARLKYTPVLEFEPDQAIEQGMRIDEIIRQLHDEDEADDTEGADGR
jgi:ribosome-binding factor A